MTDETMAVSASTAAEATCSAAACPTTYYSDPGDDSRCGRKNATLGYKPNGS